MREASFESLVELACHDLRTPLAAVNGFTKTILRAGEVSDVRFVELIDEAAGQMTVLVEQLGLAARIASGHYEPHLVEASTLELAAASGVPAAGEGAPIETDADTVVRSLSGRRAGRVGGEGRRRHGRSGRDRCARRQRRAGRRTPARPALITPPAW